MPSYSYGFFFLFTQIFMSRSPPAEFNLSSGCVLSMYPLAVIVALIADRDDTEEALVQAASSRVSA